MTDKEIIQYLKQNKLMPKAYVMNWYMNKLYYKLNKPKWLVDGTFLGYIKIYNEELDPDFIKKTINSNYTVAKNLYDKLKIKKQIN